jgi:hypothetical protein
MSTDDIAFSRRIGPDPHEGGQKTIGCDGCPDLWELQNGDIAVIGIRVTAEAAGRLPATAGCGPDEEIVIVPRATFLAAKRDIAALT